MVDVVVLNLNQEKDTLECILSLGKMRYKNYRIILVDNGSTDGSGARLKEKFGLVFLDDEKSEYLDYLKIAESRMAKKCIVVADNVKIFANTLSDYLDYVRNNYKSRMHDFGFDAMEVSERK